VVTEHSPDKVCHERDGYTITAYFPPAAPWDVVEKHLEQVADMTYDIPGDGWDPFVIGRPGRPAPVIAASEETDMPEMDDHVESHAILSSRIGLLEVELRSMRRMDAFLFIVVFLNTLSGVVQLIR
jgi:hypothetical protein